MIAVHHSHEITGNAMSRGFRFMIISDSDSPLSEDQTSVDGIASAVFARGRKSVPLQVVIGAWITPRAVGGCLLAQPGVKLSGDPLQPAGDPIECPLPDTQGSCILSFPIDMKIDKEGVYGVALFDDGSFKEPASLLATYLFVASPN